MTNPSTTLVIDFMREAWRARRRRASFSLTGTRPAGALGTALLLLLLLSAWGGLLPFSSRVAGAGASAPLKSRVATWLPWIDLAQETARQTVVDRQPGQYLGHPTTVLLEDGQTMLCVYPQGHGRGGIVLKRSSDGGRTWTDRQPVPANWATSLETPTIHRVVDAAGKRRLIVWSGLFPARLAVSEDDGVTWTPLEPAGDWGGIVVMGSLEAVRGKPGHYLAWFHDDGRYIRAGAKQEQPVVFRLYQTTSNDGGLTWSQPRELFASSDVHLCEPGVVRSPDGRRLALLLRENSRRRNSHVIFSDDEGATWSAPREMTPSLTGDRHTARYAPDGRLFISFRDTGLRSETWGDWVAWIGRFDDIANATEGQYRVRLMDNHRQADCAYPGVEILPDGTLVTTTYGHWTAGESPYVVSVRLRLEELDRRLAPPGIRVAHAPASSRQYLGSPSLVRLRDGILLAAHDLFGPGSTHDTTRVFASMDAGTNWTQRAEVRGAFWSSLFEHRDAVYLLGPNRQDGHLVIRRSTDGGRTWTVPASPETGILLADGRYHCAPMPVVEHRGRLWRAMEDVMGPGGWGKSFNSFVSSVAVDADLLVATHWTHSARLGWNGNWLGGRFGGWLEGNVVVAPNGSLLNILRCDYRDPDEKAAVIRVGADGQQAGFDPEAGFIPFPGGCKKFVIRQDPKDGSYWALANYIPAGHRGGNVERTRNTLALLRSGDALHWELRTLLLHHADASSHAFQYPDMLIDGDDLVALVRTAYDDGQGGAHNQHDANFLTFHRWPKFRTLTLDQRVVDP